MSALRAAVIGLGVGERHAAAFADAAGCELVRLCDIDEQRLGEVAERFPGVAAGADPSQVLVDPEIDVVSIATYDSAHFEQVRAALRFGKHVFCEKPLCRTPEEAVEIRHLLAADPRLVLSSNLPLRLSKRFLAVRDLLAAGKLGRLYYSEADYEFGRRHKLTEGWRGREDRYSVFLGGGVHLVDLLMWLTGERPTAVRAVGSGMATGDAFRGHDLVVATLEVPDGSTWKVAANLGSVGPHFHPLRLYGTEGSFSHSAEAGVVWSGNPLEPEATRVEADYPGVGKGDQIPSFLAAARGEGRADVPADDVFAALSVCFAVEQAVETGARVQVEYL